MIHVAVENIDKLIPWDYEKILIREGKIGKKRLKRILKARNKKSKRERIAASILLINMKRIYNLKNPFLYSISHSKDKVLCVIEDDKKGAKFLGADIEKIGLQSFKVMRKSLTSEEIKYVINSDNQSEEFIKIWTLKESYLKAIRKGITVPLDAINFKISDSEITVFDNGEKKEMFFLSEISEDGYCISVSSDVCLKKKEGEVLYGKEKSKEG